jgi:hypothetical protein
MESLKLLTSGKVGMAFGYDYHVVLANQGKLASIFPDAPVEKFSIKCGVEITRSAFPDYSQPARVVIPLYEQFLHVITTNSTGNYHPERPERQTCFHRITRQQH